MRDLEICYLPEQWRRLDPDHLRASACAVIDVIRATSTIAMALANGAAGVRPVAGISEAVALKEQNPNAILAGERGGVTLTGFDRGNSPREMTPERVRGREIILTTTNGTQALAACAGARLVVTASFLNLTAAAARLREAGPPWIVLCAGFEGHFGLDDALVAGALAEGLGREHPFAALYRSARRDLAETMLGGWSGRELTKIGMQDDVPFCAELDTLSVGPALNAAGVLVSG